MAKISAHGDKEAARWRRCRASKAGAPHEMLVTAKGRLLYKGFQRDGWVLRRRGVSVAQAGAQAAVFGMERRYGR